MPQLGESVTEGTVTRWLKSVGDVVTADEPLLEVSTDKVDTEIPAPVSGVLTEIIAGEDAVVLVGGALAVISTESASSAPVDTPIAQPAVETQTPAAPAPATPAAVEVPVAAPAGSPATSGTTAIVLPALGESVTEGTVTRWLKAVGDTVAADEALLEVSTEKVDTEIPSPVSGVLLEITGAEDGVALVGAQLGLLGVASASAPVTQAPAPVVQAPAAPTSAEPNPAPVAVTPSAPAVTVPASAATGQPINNSSAYATPLVRKLASERGVDLSIIVGTGVGGRIRKEDILGTAPTLAPVVVPSERPVASTPHVAPAPTPTPAAVTAPSMSTPAPASDFRGRTEPMTRLRKVIAERMV